MTEMTIPVDSEQITAPLSPKPTPHRLSLGTRVAMLATVVLPLFGIVAAAVFFWGWGLTWIELVLLGGMYVLTGLGITVGYHRLFTHQSFETSLVVKCILGILGSMAVQGPLIIWVGLHRKHHQFSDKHDDPHSPHNHGKGILGLLRGLWHAHLGWMFKAEPMNLSRYVKDIRQSRPLRVISALFPLWVVLGILIPTGIGYLLWGGWVGALLGLIWGGLVRIFLLHHVTWSVNSICHIWGTKPFPVRDESRNNFIVGILALGEGWHNNHHAFPTSARHGLRWWQFDASYWTICLLALMKLARKVKVPADSTYLSPTY